ncbi:MAG: phosphate signaling complex protein PhoU [Chloroflexi bacterium]|nr:phosphate signaling complex protein PhoU [Chloroflexota bacterium]
MADKPIKSRSTLDRELTVLRDSILRISHMVDAAISRSMHALKEQHVEQARQVVVDDQHINKLRYQTETDCYRLLATQQPTARDLRSIVTAIHIVVELERIGDHAVDIARITQILAQEPLLKPLIDLPRMAHIAREMMGNGLNAYLDWDEDLARQVTQRDSEIDQLENQVYRELLAFMLQDATTINRATHLLWVSHHLERIGDRITNICERVIFMVTGEMEETEENA